MNRETLVALLVVIPLLLEGAWVAWYGKAAVPGHGEPGTAVLNLTGVATAGVWTLSPVNGLNYWWKKFEPATLHVQLGDQVVINLRSADLFHRFYIPAFDVGPVDVEPGHMATVRFRADRPGVYQYYCTSMCGRCHFYMRGWLVVTAPGEEPVRPRPIACTLCKPDAGPAPDPGDVVGRGAYLYLQNGCVTCHGVEGHGGVENENAANSPVPAHDTTAQKLFLDSPDDAEAFIELIGAYDSLQDLEPPGEIRRFPVVRARFVNAKEIIRGGRYSSRLDPGGPEPPLQMPAWQYLLEEEELNALLAYFVSLYPWDEEGIHAAG